MAKGDSEALREGAEEEIENGNRLQGALLYFLAGDRDQALELALQDGGAYPVMDTSRGVFLERLRNANTRTDITYLARYYFGADADIAQFMTNMNTGPSTEEG